ncbi:putative transcription factor interactor and regulator CCHC(Zn) family [Helianthus anomalus]
MDLQWKMAMISRRVIRFMNRTGRKFVGKSVGFDKTKVRCFSYQSYGHFARECQMPKKESSSQSSSNGNASNNTFMAEIVLDVAEEKVDAEAKVDAEVEKESEAEKADADLTTEAEEEKLKSEDAKEAEEKDAAYKKMVAKLRQTNRRGMFKFC